MRALGIIIIIIIITHAGEFAIGNRRVKEINKLLVWTTEWVAVPFRVTRRGAGLVSEKQGVYSHVKFQTSIRYTGW